MLGYDINHDYHYQGRFRTDTWRAPDLQYLIKQVAAAAYQASPSDPLPSLRALVVDATEQYRQLAKALESFDAWDVLLQQMIQQIQTSREQYLSALVQCQRCEHFFARRDMFIPEIYVAAFGDIDESGITHGMTDSLYCAPCAQAEEDDFWNQRWECDHCHQRMTRCDVRAVRAPVNLAANAAFKAGFAREGYFCANCVDAALIAYRRSCVICGVVYRTSVLNVSQEVALCPDCGTPERVKEARVVRSHRDRALSAHLPATLTIAQWLQTLDDFHWRCAYCQARPYEAMEHFVPISVGGGTTVTNCVPSCASCNSSKSDTDPRVVLQRPRQQPLIGDASKDKHALAYDTVVRVSAYLQSR